MRWIVLAVLLAGCDALFQLDHLNAPPGDGRTTDVIPGPVDDALPADAVAGGPQFVQVGNEIGSGTLVTVDVPSPQTAGNLDVLLVSWVGSASGIDSVFDDTNNAWAVASSVVTTNTTNQAMYYAYGIHAGPNRVSVSFNGNMTMVNLRLLEYAGIKAATDPKIDANGAASFGTLMTSAGVSVTQKALLVGGFVTGDMTISPGTSWTERIKSAFGYAEDRTVTTGSYAAVAMQGTASPYIVHIGAFAAK